MKKLTMAAVVVILILISTFVILEITKEPSKKETISVATSSGGALGFASEVLKKEKIDLQNGIEIDFKYFSPAQAEMALFNRVVEMGYFAPISAVRANIEGKPIRIIGAALWNHYSILTKADSNITSLNELKGKKFGSLERYTGGYTNLAVILAMRGEDIEKYFSVIIGQPNTLIAFLERGDVDAIMLYEPLVSKLMAKHMAKKIVSMEELWEEEFPNRPLLMLGFAAHKDWLGKNTEKAKKVTNAYYQTFHYIKDHPEIIEEPWAKQILSIESEEEAAMLKKNLANVYPDGWNESIIQSAEFLLQKSLELGLIKSLPEESIFVKLE